MSSAVLLGRSAEEFGDWSRQWHWTWDNAVGRSCVQSTINGTIQPGILIRSPATPIPIQHRQIGCSSSDNVDHNSPRQLHLLSVSSTKSIRTFTPPSRQSVNGMTSTSSKRQIPLFTTKYFEVLKTLDKGYAAFANQEISKGTVILREKPLLRTTEASFIFEYDKLSMQDKRAFKTLCSFDDLDMDENLARFKTNRFQAGGRQAIFRTSSRFNHACPPQKTCSYRYNQSDNMLYVTAHTHIRKGQELTISYTNEPTTLYENYGFHCTCESCPEGPPQEKKSFKQYW